MVCPCLPGGVRLLSRGSLLSERGNTGGQAWLTPHWGGETEFNTVVGNGGMHFRHLLSWIPDTFWAFLDIWFDLKIGMLYSMLGSLRCWRTIVEMFRDVEGCKGGGIGWGWGGWEGKMNLPKVIRFCPDIWSLLRGNLFLSCQTKIRK